MAAGSVGLAVNADLGPALWPLFVLPGAVGRVQRPGQRRARRHRARTSSGGPRCPPPTPSSRPCSSSGWWWAPRWPACCWPGPGSASCTGWTWRASAAALVAVFLISPQPPGRGGGPPAWPALDPRGAPLRPRAPGHPGRVPDRHQRHGVRHAAGACSRRSPARCSAAGPRRSASCTPRQARAPCSARSPPAGSAVSGARASPSSARSSRGASAITCFGLVRWLPGALVLLAVAGGRDVISAVFRNTIVQLAVPDALRGRLSGLQTAVVAGGPRIGDVEAGAVAAAFGDTRPSSRAAWPASRAPAAGPAAARLPPPADDGTGRAHLSARRSARCQPVGRDSGILGSVGAVSRPARSAGPGSDRSPGGPPPRGPGRGRRSRRACRR